MDTFGRLTGSCGIEIRRGESRDREDETVCRWLGLGLSVRSDLVFFRLDFTGSLFHLLLLET